VGAVIDIHTHVVPSRLTCRFQAGPAVAQASSYRQATMPAVMIGGKVVP